VRRRRTGEGPSQRTIRRTPAHPRRGAVKHKVLHIIYSLYRGGAERVIEAHLRASPDSQYSFVICALTGGGDLVERLADAGAHVILLGKAFRGDPGTFFRLARLIRRERPDILHLHNAPGALWGTLAAMIGGVRTPIVRTEHRPYIPEALNPMYRLLYPRLARRADRIICVCEAVRRSYTKRYPKLSGRYATIYNGIPTAPFESTPPKQNCRERFKLPPVVPLVGTVGRLVPVKNHRDLITAFSLVKEQIPDAHLAIVGSGTLKDALIRHAADFAVGDAVSFIPEVPDIEQFYRAIDLFALPSHSEGLPLCLIEAFAAGLPAVATGVGGIPEVITDGSNGYLVPPAEPDALAKRITELLRDPELAARMGAEGRETVIRRFRAETMAHAIEELYAGLLV
jgi:glycosyltransferase involved in cell wall biosynthesis